MNQSLQDAHLAAVTFSTGTRLFVIGLIGTIVSSIVGSKRYERKGPPENTPRGRGSWLGIRYSRFAWGGLALAGLVIMVVVH